MARTFETKEKPPVNVGEYFEAPCFYDHPYAHSWRKSDGTCRGCGRVAESSGHGKVRVKLLSVGIKGGVFADAFIVAVEDAPNKPKE